MNFRSAPVRLRRAPWTPARFRGRPWHAVMRRNLHPNGRTRPRVTVSRVRKGWYYKSRDWIWNGPGFVGSMSLTSSPVRGLRRPCHVAAAIRNNRWF